MAYVIARWGSTLCSERYAFHKPPFIWVDCSKSARNEEPSSYGRFQQRPASGDSGLQLNLEIAQAVSQRRLSSLTGFEPGRRCVETSGNVIQNIFTITPASRIWDLSPMRLGSRNKR